MEKKDEWDVDEGPSTGPMDGYSRCSVVSVGLLVKDPVEPGGSERWGKKKLSPNLTSGITSGMLTRVLAQVQWMDTADVPLYPSDCLSRDPAS